MINQQPEQIHAAGGGYGPPPGGGYPGGGYGAPPGGAPMAPPGGGPMMGGMPGMPGGGGGGGGDIEAVKKTVQTWLILSFVSIFCGCGLLALVPILFAFQAKTAAEQGNATLALEKIKISKICIIIGWVLLVISIILNVVMAVAGAAM